MDVLSTVHSLRITAAAWTGILPCACGLLIIAALSSSSFWILVSWLVCACASLSYCSWQDSSGEDALLLSTAARSLFVLCSFGFCASALSAASPGMWAISLALTAAYVSLLPRRWSLPCFRVSRLRLFASNIRSQFHPWLRRTVCVAAAAALASLLQAAVWSPGSFLSWLLEPLAVAQLFLSAWLSFAGLSLVWTLNATILTELSSLSTAAALRCLQWGTISRHPMVSRCAWQSLERHCRLPAIVQSDRAAVMALLLARLRRVAGGKAVEGPPPRGVYLLEQMAVSGLFAPQIHAPLGFSLRSVATKVLLKIRQSIQFLAADFAPAAPLEIAQLSYCVRCLRLILCSSGRGAELPLSASELVEVCAALVLLLRSASWSRFPTLQAVCQGTLSEICTMFAPTLSRSMVPEESRLFLEQLVNPS